MDKLKDVEAATMAEHPGKTALAEIVEVFADATDEWDWTNDKCDPDEIYTMAMWGSDVVRIARCNPRAMKAVSDYVAGLEAQVKQLESDLFDAGMYERAAEELPLVEAERDALAGQVATLQSVLLPIIERDRKAFFESCTIGDNPATLDSDDAASVAEYDKAISLLKDTQSTAIAHNARIRAEALENGATLAGFKFAMGQRVTKTKGSSWTGHVVGFYRTSLTNVGYAIESETETGSVQIYPEPAIRALAEKERNNG